MKISDAPKALLKKNGRFVIAGGLFVVLVLVVVFLLGKGAGKPKQEADPNLISPSVAEPFEVDSDQKIRDLILSYYNYYAAGDTVSLERITKNLSESEKGFVDMFSQYVENYENLVCYVKGGLDEDSRIVSTAIDIHFAGMTTLAPGLDFFYVEKDENGSYYINNLYCQYNNLTEEQERDPTISAMIDQYEAQPDVIALREEVEARYEEAVSSDEALGNLISTTIHDAYASWAENVRAAKEAENAPETEATEAVEDLTNMQLVTLDRVNVRSTPGEDGEVLATVDPGTIVTLLSDMGNGWFNVDVSGTNGYIRSDFLANAEEAAAGGATEGEAQPADAQPAEAQPEEAAQPEAPAADTGSAPAAGSSVRISSSVNVRADMSEEATKLGTAFEGEYVTVIDNYAEGWTKVDWNGQTGFIRTDLLH